MKIVSLHQNPQFVPVLAQWFHHQWGYLHPSRTIEDVIKDLKKSSSKDSGLPYIAVLEMHGEAIGTASLIEQDMPDLEKAKAMTPWLASVYVTPEYRQQGVGEKLLFAIDDKAKNLEFKQIYLFTPDKSDWYLKYGWKILEKTQYHGETVYIMNKWVE